MRWCDKTATRSFGIPSLFLMENAGRGSADSIARSFGPLSGLSVVIACGKGNNGGDGFVVARHILNQGAVVTVLLVAPPSQLKGDALLNFKILNAIQKQSPQQLSIKKIAGNILSRTRGDLVVDALLGTGFSGSIRAPYAGVIDWMNKQKVPVVALDLPSGINGTTGEMTNKAVKAGRTVTMGAIKAGLLCNQGREHAGYVEVIDIGIPSSVYRSEHLQTFQMEAGDVREALPRRKKTAHKYSVGKVFVLAGSTGFTGAAALTASAALRSGAGAVVLGTPQTVYPILAKKLSETIVVPLPSTHEGSLSLAGRQPIEDRMRWADVTVIGPGLSQNAETMDLVVKLLSGGKGRILIDADGLNAVAAAGTRLLRNSKAEIIVTPHTGEFSRLAGVAASDTEVHRIERAREFSKTHRVAIVLKGAPTATADPEGTVVLNSTGNAGMATVGSGDVLSGIVAGLWAQGMGRMQAASSGVWLHGKSGDLAAAKLGERSIVAQDLIDYLPPAMQTVQDVD
jgi:NAD(P)H-hydrate epimerase